MYSPPKKKNRLKPPNTKRTKNGTVNLY